MDEQITPHQNSNRTSRTQTAIEYLPGGQRLVPAVIVDEFIRNWYRVNTYLIGQVTIYKFRRSKKRWGSFEIIKLSRVDPPGNDGIGFNFWVNLGNRRHPQSFPKKKLIELDRKLIKSRPGCDREKALVNIDLSKFFRGRSRSEQHATIKNIKKNP